MTQWWWFVLTGVLSYLIGGFSTAVVVSTALAKIDIRRHGSGNAGSTNMARVLGWQYGVLTIVGDMAKGAAAILLGQWIAGPNGIYAAGLFVILGHDFPIYFRFRGGKGIATSIVVYAFILPWEVTMITLGICVVIILTTRLVSLASLLGSFGLMVYGIIAFPHNIALIVTLVAMAGLAAWQHRYNVLKLINGTERRFSLSRKKKGGKETSAGESGEESQTESM